MTDIPNEAIEAAAWRMYQADMRELAANTWELVPCYERVDYLNRARVALEAALPIIDKARENTSPWGDLSAPDCCPECSSFATLYNKNVCQRENCGLKGTAPSVSQPVATGGADRAKIEALEGALREAISQLNDWCEEIDGEGFNNPAWNDLLAKRQSHE